MLENHFVTLNKFRIQHLLIFECNLFQGRKTQNKTGDTSEDVTPLTTPAKSTRGRRKGKQTVETPETQEVS